jgi:hypothetical protein
VWVLSRELALEVRLIFGRTEKVLISTHQRLLLDSLSVSRHCRGL